MIRPRLLHRFGPGALDEAGIGEARGEGIAVFLGGLGGLGEARALGLDVAGMRSKGVTFAETLGVIPRDVRDSKAVETDAWLAPTLKDFTDSEWNDLGGAEKREVAGHFAWAKSEAAAEFEDLKLPHHRASDGAVGLLQEPRGFAPNVIRWG